MIDWFLAVAFVLVMVLIGYFICLGLFAIWFICSCLFGCCREAKEDFRIKVTEKPKALPHARPL